jgi:heme/copper-type cytochrome/quinol oxidase subunit 2
MDIRVAAATRETSRSWIWLLPGLAVLGILFAPLPAVRAVPMPRQVRVEASSFEFRPGVVEVNPGDQVTMELVSTDVVHGLYLEGYDLQIVAEPGQTTTLSFTADRAGTFRFRCSVTCGPLHPFMIGKLKVGNNNLLWRGVALATLAALVGLWGWRK